jgi:cytochrome c553
MRRPIVFGALAALVVLAAPANTAEVVADPSTQREFIAKMGMCSQCHGGNGMPARPYIPIIWGQQQDFLVKQIHDFESGARTNELMTWAAKTLHPEEREAGAAYFAKKTWPARTTPAAAAATPRPGGMAVCEACHQLNFAGGLLVPRLAGQNYEYLVESMRRFADGERNNNPEMTAMMKALTVPQRETMAHYLSGL